jgi:hypothetical protein
MLRPLPAAPTLWCRSSGFYANKVGPKTKSFIWTRKISIMQRNPASSVLHAMITTTATSLLGLRMQDERNNLFSFIILKRLLKLKVMGASLRGTQRLRVWVYRSVTKWCTHDCTKSKFRRRLLLPRHRVSKHHASCRGIVYQS